MRRYYFFLILIFLQFKIPLYSADKMTVAVLDLSPKGVPILLSNAISDIIRTEFTNIGNFTVVERAQMRQILKEHELQMTGCTDSECAVKFGKILSARRIVVGEVNSIGSSVLITIRYVDVEKGVSLFSATEKSISIEDIDRAAVKITKDLASRIVSGDKEILIPITTAGYYTRGIVPGWGQFYSGDSTKGYIFLGSFIVAGALTVYGWLNYSNAKSEYDDLDRGTSQSTFDEKYNAKKEAGDQFLMFAGMATLVYLANWVDILFFSRPAFRSLSSNYFDRSLISVNMFYHYPNNHICEIMMNFSLVKRF